MKLMEDNWLNHGKMQIKLNYLLAQFGIDHPSCVTTWLPQGKYSEAKGKKKVDLMLF